MTGTFEGVGTLQFTPDNKHAYAYSGLIVSHTTAVTVLDFTTNSEYIEGCFQLNGAVDDDSPADVTLASANVSFNETSIFILVTGNNVHRAAMSVSQKIIIPPFTRVIIVVDMEAIAADQYASVIFTGKVGGAIQQENLESITNNNKWASK